MGTYKFFECRFRGGDIMRWWGHSNLTLCKRICLSFLHSLAAGLQELQAQALMPLFMTKKPGETSLNRPLLCDLSYFDQRVIEFLLMCKLIENMYFPNRQDPRWIYSVRSGTCQPVPGGCPSSSNFNNFDSRSDCESACK